MRPQEFLASIQEHRMQRLDLGQENALNLPAILGRKCPLTIVPIAQNFFQFCRIELANEMNRQPRLSPRARRVTITGVKVQRMTFLKHQMSNLSATWAAVINHETKKVSTQDNTK